MADHNDPNAVNSIFSDIDMSAADVFDMFGFPVEDAAGGDKAVVALTFAPVPQAGVLDEDLLYRILVAPHPRVARPDGDDHSLDALLKYFDAVRQKYFGEFSPAELRVTVEGDGHVKVRATGFPGGDFTEVLPTNEVVTVDVAGGQSLKVFVGGRDDAFFNDLPGFFRSINYAPQYYHVPHTMQDARELPIPKTLLELDGNVLFNFDPSKPDWGHGVKENLPPGPWTWTGDRFLKDADGNFRFVYSGKDAQAGKNINAIAVEMPLEFITHEPAKNRIVNIWAESWVRRAAHKVESIPDDHFWTENPLALFDALHHDDELKRYKLVDTVGQPFADAALNERYDSRQVGANNFWLAPHFVKRLGHLGWGFGPSITALGLKSAFDHGDAKVSVHKTYASALTAFPRTKKLLFQELNMPDDTWNKRQLDIPLRRSYEIFVPNVCALDMDTTGTWPYGRRLEDQVATRFLSLFLDMEGELNGNSYNVETLNDPALWAAAPITPKTPPNPVKNDKEFLAEFPYLAEPWA